MSGWFVLSLLWGPVAQAEPVEVNLWHAYRGDERTALERMVTAWDEQHDEVTVHVLALPPEGFTQKFEAAGPHGNGPDLLIAAHERVGAWSDARLLAPFTDVPADLHPVAISALTWEGAVYGLPLATKSLALFYNRALVAAPPRTTDAMLALKNTLPDGVFTLAVPAADPFFHAPWMFGFGGGVFDADGQVALDQPENAAAMGFVKSLVDSGVAPEEATGVLVTQLFNEGHAALAVNGPWFLGEIDPSVDFGIVPLPEVSATGRPAAPFLTVEAVLLSAYARQPEAATALARYLVTEEVAVVRAVEGRQAVATLSALSHPEVADDPILGAFRAQLEASVPTPNVPAMAATWEPQARALRRVLRGAQSPEDAVRAAQVEYNIVTAPAPPPADPRPYLALAAVVVAGLAVVGGRRFWAARKAVWAHRSAYGYVAPAFVGLALLVVAPFVLGTTMSLFSYQTHEPRFVGLANFTNILLSRDWPFFSPLSFYTTLAVTVLWTAANVFLHVTIGVALAMLLREPWLRLRGVYRVLLILPWAIPNYITALIWKGMFQKQFGAINAILGLLGVEPISWFSSFTTAFAANLTTNTWLGFPFMMVVTLGALQAIPRELEQAAEVDGTTGWQRFRHITLPLLMPALLPAIVLGSVWTFNMINIIYLVSGGEPDGWSEILISEAYRWAFDRNHRYGYASAYAVLVFIVLVVYSKTTDRWLAGRTIG